jgi:hypothetical protein
MDIPVVRMKRPIRYQSKRGKDVPKMPRPSTRPIKGHGMTRKRIPTPTPFNQFNINTANVLYDPKNPSPKVDIETSKLFRKMEELQDTLKRIKKKREKVSMNRSAKAYLNALSYNDPILENSLKLNRIKGTAFG